MRANRIPAFLRQFIHDHINSVEQLEVLLLLRCESQKWWSALEVSTRLFTTEGSAAMRLIDLYDANFLEMMQENGQQLYRYAPPESSVDDTIGALDRAYRERKDSIIHIIFSPPASRARSFADAFLLRRHD